MEALWQGDLVRGLGLAVVSCIIFVAVSAIMRTTVGTRSSASAVRYEECLTELERHHARDRIEKLKRDR
ncbi:MAG: hypothetical protein K2X49_11495 [Acetobacteraceae bacterium]|nr:hypothetical protein [Acetobacteraceae bacterium]